LEKSDLLRIGKERKKFGGGDKKTIKKEYLLGKN
jgi:hypothetical protein